MRQSSYSERTAHIATFTFRPAASKAVRSAAPASISGPTNIELAMRSLREYDYQPRPQAVGPLRDYAGGSGSALTTTGQYSNIWRTRGPHETDLHQNPTAPPIRRVFSDCEYSCHRPSSCPGIHASAFPSRCTPSAHTPLHNQPDSKLHRAIRRSTAPSLPSREFWRAPASLFGPRFHAIECSGSSDRK